MTTLQPDQWELLTTLADAAGGWVTEDTTKAGRRRRTTAVNELVAEGLVELDQTLDEYRDQEGRRPGWAARILADGLLVLRYRQLHDASWPELPQPVEPPMLAGIELTTGELETLRHFVALGPLLPGARTRALADALAQAVPGPGTNRWTVPASSQYLDAIGSAFRLEMLAGTGTSRSYHRLWREHRTHQDPQARLTVSSPSD